MQNCVCTDTEFRCDNGKCIRPSLKCDNRNQCGDYSDEAGCPCLVNQFRCQTTPLCVHEDHWCDGTPDCPDGSDELQNCTCLSSQGKCSSGQCIPGSKLCDRRLDCQDRSDETWCPCGSWEFRCENGLCYDKSRWCDGKDDCFDGSDEKPNCTCLREQTKCKTSGKCIMDYQICDGTEHCEDGSDEMNCNCSVTQFRCGTGQCIEVQKYCDGDPDCPDNSDEPGLKCGCLPSHFTCSSGLCVSRAVLCDGTDDCGDGSDESYTLTGCNSTFCNEFQFKCPNGGCISLDKVCDRRLDCHDGRDEMQNCECRSNEFLCPSSTNCIHMSYVCDGYEHCDDGADEIQNCVCPNTTHFQCGNGRCVLGSERCDRDDDCGDNTDELHCGCKPYQWECGDGRCIEKQWVCDGHQDCADGDDEMACNVCEAGQFSCGDNTTCVPARAQCDGMVNCPNGRDEKNCLRLDASNETMTGVAKAWHQNQWYPICFIDVNSRWFDRICKELGHGTVIHVHSVNVTSNLYMKLNTSIATPLVRGSLVPSTGCNGSKALSLSCGSKICGTKSPNLPEVEMAASRVTGGEQATEGAWPWQASLMTLIGGHYCGATLINKQWLLTGAHCIDWLPSFLHRYLAVRLGSVKLVLPDAKSVVVRVKATYSHPQFETPSAINNDIALLKLEAPVTYTDYIRPVCLPSVDEPVSPKRRCYITGWGATQGNRATATMHLREAKAQEETDAVCDAATSLMTYVYNATTMMCALYESGIINACAGDSGGPMVCEDMTGRWVLHGVNSWGHIVCNKPTFPSVFTEVYHYRDWIDQVIKDNP
ncbi:atrial natriuretic peptide-converting enzyme [Lingula anatina]|uniref:Atrial natriuretic peptide-converting enzyme n=1 Tax=Lingula anatina TaxID=7574 RepID=A0A2R2MSB7_LINAN|nr:atrial natriuretic peptide-converting enzyme [Lingula anatina]|eukprot:XP_023933160.1 atrial natriuretic peptide-converting enzyme [Lingula anatina]